jgi:hypothetical protein
VNETGSWGLLIFGVLFSAAMLASWNTPHTGAIPRRKERPGWYWTYLVIALGGTLIGAATLLSAAGL